MYTETKRSIQERKNIQIVMMSKILIWTLFVLILIVIVPTVLVLYNILPDWLLFTITIYYITKDVLNDRNNE